MASDFVYLDFFGSLGYSSQIHKSCTTHMQKMIGDTSKLYKSPCNIPSYMKTKNKIIVRYKINTKK